VRRGGGDSGHIGRWGNSFPEEICNCVFGSAKWSLYVTVITGPQITIIDNGH